MADVVFSGVSDHTVVQGNLFQGIKFWLSQKVPQRSRFINDVKANGGEVLPIEKHADLKIVDHARKEALPGTYSYTFIEKSVRNGVLEELQNHRVGPVEGTVRTIGSIVQPAKGTRNKFTDGDDHILWEWVREHPQKGGGTDGNEIYKQLETKHPQHPWQSWRDRFIKHLKGKPPPFPRPHNAPPTPPSDAPVSTEEPKRKENPLSHDEADFEDFSEEEAEMLMKWGETILNIPPDFADEAWEAWTKGIEKDQRHSAREWHVFWETSVRPRFLRRLAKQAKRAASEQPALPEPKTSTNITDPANISSSPFSPFTNKQSKTKPRSRSSSNYPESPSMQLTGRSPYVQATSRNGKSTTNITSSAGRDPRDKSELSKTSGSADESLKRKHPTLDEEIPSSSPIQGRLSPKRRRPDASELPREIASTPEGSPKYSGKRPYSPLFIDIDDESEEANSGSEVDVDEQHSPISQGPSEILSKPRRGARDTQSLFREPTLPIDFDVPPLGEGWDEEELEYQNTGPMFDFDVPPPKEGWDDETSRAEPSESGSRLETSATEAHDAQRANRSETQAIFQRQTQPPDFTVAEPVGGWDPPPMPASSDNESEALDVDVQTDAWIDAHINEEFSEEQVTSALKSCTMDTSLAEEVLKHLESEGKIPGDRRGVWTEMDDEDLGSTDARTIQKLEKKHGADGIKARWDFLSFLGTA